MLSQSVLAAELAAIEPSLDVIDSANAWADAYMTYARDAMALTPIISGAVTLARVPMLAGFLGMSAPNAAAGVIAAGITAFWTSIISAPPAAFSGAVVIVPPPLLTLSADLATAFADIQDAQKSVEDAAADIAAVIHSQTIMGGTVTTPGAPPVITGIL